MQNSSRGRTPSGSIGRKSEVVLIPFDDTRFEAAVGQQPWDCRAQTLLGRFEQELDQPTNACDGYVP